MFFGVPTQTALQLFPYKALGSQLNLGEVINTIDVDANQSLC